MPALPATPPPPGEAPEMPPAVLIVTLVAATKAHSILVGSVLNAHNSFSAPPPSLLLVVAVVSEPLPPNIQSMVPVESVQPMVPKRALGLLVTAPVPFVPIVSVAPTALAPDSNVQLVLPTFVALGVNFQTSFREPA